MGKPVTLDSDDVEALIYAAELSAKISQMVDVTREDPGTQRNKPRLRAAADNCRAAWQDAIRERDPTADDPLSAVALDALNRMRVDFDDEPRGPLPRPTDPGVDELRRKGMCVLGAASHSVNWGDGTRTVRPLPDVLWKITARGYAALPPASR